jgi:hypothetical protein
VAAPWDQLTVAFDGDALALERELANEVGDRRRRRETDMGGAVDDERKHKLIPEPARDFSLARRMSAAAGTKTAYTVSGRLLRLASVTLHRDAQEAQLLVKVLARVAQDQMQP